MDFFNDKQLLLLEDSDEFIENAVALFNMFVKKTFVAKSINEAFKILKKEKIDLIISDIHLKNECGLDFIKKIRISNNETPILVLSGYKDEDLLFKAMTLNLSGYLIKPINFKVLMEALVKCENKSIFVKMLDAIDGTPVIDIKPIMKEFLPTTKITQPDWSIELMKNYWK